jgi:hypothetical protein
MLDDHQEHVIRAAHNEHLPDNITWQTLEMYFRGAIDHGVQIDIGERKPEDWMASFHLFRRTFRQDQKKFSGKRDVFDKYNLVIVEAARDEEYPDDIAWPMLRPFLKAKNICISDREGKEWMESLQNWRQAIQQDSESHRYASSIDSGYAELVGQSTSLTKGMTDVHYRMKKYCGFMFSPRNMPNRESLRTR